MSKFLSFLFKKVWINYLLAFFISVCIFFFIVPNFWSLHIPSQSMYPNLYINDNVFVSSLDDTKKVENGKVYSFILDKNYAKRLIAQSGDTIAMKTNDQGGYDFFVNNKKLKQERININDLKQEKIDAIKEIYGHVDFDFFLETHNGNSYIVMYKDFKHIKQEVVEKYLLREFSYTLKEGELFFLGDNRNDSADSRFYNVTKVDQVKYEVKKVLFNNDFIKNKYKRYFLREI